MDSDVVCVLVSCIYFKGEWHDKFKLRDTSDAKFYCTKEKTSSVKMMTQEKYCSYLSVDQKGFKCVGISYKQRDSSMLISLPNERFGLKSVIKNLDVKTIESLKDPESFSTKLVSLEMPKFKIEYEASLNEILPSLGIIDAFDENKSDLSDF